MNEVIFINIGIFIETHLHQWQDRDLPSRTRIFIGQLLARGKTPGLPNLSNLSEAKKSDAQTGIGK